MNQKMFLCGHCQRLSRVVVGTMAAAGLTALCALPGAAQTSSVAGVGVPKGGASVSESGTTSGMGRLLADGAKLFNLPSGGNGKAEVYFWSGENYKAGRARFMMSLLNSNLTEAGYTVTEVDGFVDNTPNMFDEEKYGVANALNIGYGKKAQYFHATNPETKKTLVGMWLDQEDQKRVVLAIAGAGFAAGPAATHVPDVPDGMWLVKDFKDASKGLPVPALPAFPKLAPKPRTVRGLIKDVGGRPVAGARLVVETSAAGGFRTKNEGTSNAEGLYEIPLPVGIGQVVNADCRIEYNGKELLLPLHPVDGERDNFDSREGHVENFVLRTSGSAGARNGSYGAPLRVLTWELPDRCTVEVILKPLGPLVDGSTIKPLVFRWKGPKAGLSGETFLQGIPLGRYKLTAKVYDGEDALPLRAKKVTDDDYVSALTVEFEDDGTNRASLGKSSVRQFDVTLKP